jgi:hypothetical protein
MLQRKCRHHFVITSCSPFPLLHAFFITPARYTPDAIFTSVIFISAFLLQYAPFQLQPRHAARHIFVIAFAFTPSMPPPDTMPPFFITSCTRICHQVIITPNYRQSSVTVSSFLSLSVFDNISSLFHC